MRLLSSLIFVPHCGRNQGHAEGSIQRRFVTPQKVFLTKGK